MFDDFLRVNMFRTLGGKILCLFLLVMVISLSAAVVLRFMLVSDFTEYRQGEMLDRVQWITAAIEGTYERSGGWSTAAIERDALRSLMLGLDIAVYDRDDSLITTSSHAFNSLSPAMRSRVEGTLAAQRLGERGESMSFPLFSKGEEIGVVDIAFLEREKDLIFMNRADRFLVLSLAVTALLVVAISFGLAKGITSPLHQLAQAAGDIGRGNRGRQVAIQGSDEIAVLANTFNGMSEKLDQQEQLRKKLISNVAHELRTPVAAMRAELEALLDGIIPLRKETLESLLEETGRLTSLIEGIEDITRAEAGTLTLKRETVQLLPFLHLIKERFSSLFLEAGVDLALRCSRNETIIADPEKLERIMVNLLGNAAAATESGGQVTISTFQEQDRTILKVADTGCGMDREVLSRVFERFYSIRSGGLGLGLPIVKELVEAHGGTITLESEEGRGTTATVSIPVLHSVS